jgi:hypothetical protein
MGIVNLALVALGVALIAVGYSRARGPWRRYQAMRAQQANQARYDSWRGGIRGDPGERTGAQVMIEELRRQTQLWGLVLIAGFVLVLLGFLVR